MQHWLIVGASGGIGFAMVQQLLTQGHRVSAISRQPQSSTLSTPFEIAHTQQALTWYTLAAADDTAAPMVFAEIFASKVDAVMLCQGWLHGEGMLPEKSIKQLSRRALAQSYEINVIHPALYLQALLPFLAKHEAIKVAVLSAKVGSISDNQLGGWYSYRMAKAALNMLVKTSSIELARYNKTAVLFSLHPGTTDSELSAPFQKNLPQGQLRSAADTASRLIAVFAAVTPEQTGVLMNWDGMVLPF